MTEQIWVFGYGSLMWRPGFDCLESHQALLHGMHRRLCIYSHVHRGTPDRPGLVMGLDRGGACRGMAFRIDPDNWPATLTYLREREQVTMVYLEKSVKISLLSPVPRNVPALTYVVDRNHTQYAGKLTIEDQLSFIRQGTGISGPCDEYVTSLTEHIRDMGLHDGILETLYSGLQSPGTTESA